MVFWIIWIIIKQSLTIYNIGFKNICDIEDVRRAYPLLDMIDKEKRYENLDVSQSNQENSLFYKYGESFP